MKDVLKIRLFIADDHVLFNDGIKEILTGETDFLVVGQAYSGAELMEQLPLQKPDVLLLDINMPGKSGIELVGIISKEYPHISVIMLTMYSDKQFVLECKRMKVKGYLLKNASKEKLINAIRNVIIGEDFYDPILDEEKNIHQDDEFVKKFKLTKRELEIIKLVKQNYTAQEIAEMLFLSVFTVETHRRNINLKLNVRNTLALIKFTNEHDI